MRDSRERGAVMVEFALVVPILLLLVLGLIEYGYRYSRASVVNNAAFVAARDYSIHKNAAEAQAAGRAADADMPAGATFGGFSCPAGGNVTVTITSTESSPTGLFPGGDSFVINAKGVARCEN
jgi:Flp pilus assembly protein TadG